MTNENPKYLNIYDMWINSRDINEIKQWIDERKEEGYTHISLDIEYDYYSDIDALYLKATNK